MIIANPIYDVVFKYLFEDLDIAKGILSRIIGEEIESLEVKSQETMQENPLQLVGISLLRLDFKAVIWVKKTEEELAEEANIPPAKKTKKKSKQGNDTEKPSVYHKKKVLIELQKAKELFDIMRFRKYLAENYSKSDTYVGENGKNETGALPIITIYFLGFYLENIKIPVLKVARTYQNVLENKEIKLRKKEPFVELLTHESYMIQVLRLEKTIRTPLERLLSIFNQQYIYSDDKYRLAMPEDNVDEMVAKAQRRLERAAGDDALRKSMDIEEEMERTFWKKIREAERKAEAKAEARAEARAQIKIAEAMAKIEAEKAEAMAKVEAEKAEAMAKVEAEKAEAQRLLTLEREKALEKEHELQAKIEALLKQMEGKD